MRDNRSSIVWLGLFGIVGLGLAYLMFMPRGGSRDDLTKRATSHPAVGMKLPALEVAPLTGGERSWDLESLSGKVVLVNFWGPWCGYCIQEFPHLAEIANGRRQRDDFVFLPIAYGNSPDQSVDRLRTDSERFLARQKIAPPMYHDPRHTATRAAATLDAFHGNLPVTFLLDRAGIVRAVWSGYQPGMEHGLAQLIDELLEQH